MHYEISYEGLAPKARRAKALQDIKDWLGKEQFIKLTALFRSYEESLSLEQFRMATRIAGIQGYPVKAWFHHCFPDQSPPE